MDENKTLHRRFYELFNRGDLNALGEMLSADVIDHDAVTGQARGREGMIQVLGLFLNAFPGMNISIEDLIAEGDLVMDRVTARGTHQGELLGIPPTGKQVQLQAINTHRYRDGKIVEVWHLEDNFSMLQQLGVVPPPPNPEATD